MRSSLGWWFVVLLVMTGGLPARAADWHDIQLYNCLGPVHRFADVEVSLVGSAEALGLKKSEIVEYAHQVFDKRFGSMRQPALEIDALRGDVDAAAQTGLLQFTIWTVREQYPVVFHIEGRIGSAQCLFDGRDFHRTTYLGYVPSVEVPSTVKDSIREVIERSAKRFFELRYAP
jgi:predicted DNA-binding transcriptional regulator